MSRVMHHSRATVGLCIQVLREGSHRLYFEVVSHG